MRKFLPLNAPIFERTLSDEGPQWISPVQRVIQPVIENRAPVRIVEVVPRAGPRVWIIQVGPTEATIAIAIAIPAITVAIAAVTIETIIVERASKQ